MLRTYKLHPLSLIFFLLFWQNLLFWQKHWHWWFINSTSGLYSSYPRWTWRGITWEDFTVSESFFKVTPRRGKTFINQSWNNPNGMQPPYATGAPLSTGVHFRNPRGCLKPQIVLNPIYNVFFLYILFFMHTHIHPW